VPVAVRVEQVVLGARKRPFPAHDQPSGGRPAGQVDQPGDLGRES
jgi:hypothetical protein